MVFAESCYFCPEQLSLFAHIGYSQNENQQFPCQINHCNHTHFKRFYL